MPRASRSLVWVLAALLPAVLSACRCASCYLATDFYVVTEPGGGSVEMLDPDGEGPPALEEPVRVRRTSDRLAWVGATRAARLRADCDGAVTVGRVLVEPAPARSPDRLVDVELFEIARCESEDGGAWWFDGALVRARPAVAREAQLVLQVAHAAQWTQDGAVVLGPNARWSGVARRLQPGVSTVLGGGGRTWSLQAEARVCVQISVDPQLPRGAFVVSCGEGLTARLAGERDGSSRIGDELVLGGPDTVAGAVRASFEADGGRVLCALESAPLEQSGGGAAGPGVRVRVSHERGVASDGESADGSRE